MELDAFDCSGLIPDPALADFLTEQGDLPTAWRLCERADWLLLLATAAGVPRPVIVSIACDLIEDVARARAGALLSEGVGAEAWQLAKLWSRGVASSRECWAAGFRAKRHDGATDLDAACAEVALACDGDAALAYYTDQAHAARAVGLLDGTLDLAERVRARLRIADVAAGLMRRALTSLPPERASVLPAHDSTPPAVVSRSGLRDAQAITH